MTALRRGIARYGHSGPRLASIGALPRTSLAHQPPHDDTQHTLQHHRSSHTELRADLVPRDPLKRIGRPRRRRRPSTPHFRELTPKPSSHLLRRMSLPVAPLVVPLPRLLTGRLRAVPLPPSNTPIPLEKLPTFPAPRAPGSSASLSVFLRHARRIAPRRPPSKSLSRHIVITLTGSRRPSYLISVPLVFDR